MEDLLLPTTDVDRIAHIVERRDTGQGALAALIDAQRLPISIVPKHDDRTCEWVHPFGGCDMVSYEYRKAIQKKLSTGTHRFPFRGLLRALQGIPTRKVFMSQADLTAMCEADPAKYPKRTI
jgi:hypothetical protein